MADEKIREIKLCLLGDSGVGKTCLALRFVRERFDPHLKGSVGASFLSKTLKLNGQGLRLNIWDTAGQEIFRSQAPLYYRGASAAVIVYDITSGSTFESAKQWVTELRQKGPEEIFIAIAGNKKDLADMQRISTETGQNYADEIGAVFFECSALTGENVDAIFTGISQKLPPERSGFEHQGFSPKNVPGTKKKCC